MEKIWTLDEATNDVLETLEKIRGMRYYREYHGVESAEVISMKEVDKHYEFIIRLELEQPITITHPQSVEAKVKSQVVFKRRYRNKKEKSMNDWNDDD